MNISIKTVLSIALTSILLIQNVSAKENNSFYLSGKLGTSLVGFSKQKIGFYEADGGDRIAKYTGQSLTKSVLSGGVAIGYDFYEEYKKPFRTEFEVILRNNMMSSYHTPNFGGFSPNKVTNDISLNTFMMNNYYDFNNESAFTPYISLGVGLASIRHTMNSENEDFYLAQNDPISTTERNFAWSLGIGTKFAMTDTLALDVSYRYLDAGSSLIRKRDNGMLIESKQKVRTSDIMLGVIYNF